MHFLLFQVLSLQHSSSDSCRSQFAAYWKPILSMDANFWQRWLHMHRIVILLEHDMYVWIELLQFSWLWDHACREKDFQNILISLLQCAPWGQRQNSCVNCAWEQRVEDGSMQWTWGNNSLICFAGQFQSICIPQATMAATAQSSAASLIQPWHLCYVTGVALCWWKAIPMWSSCAGEEFGTEWGTAGLDLFQSVLENAVSTKEKNLWGSNFFLEKLVSPVPLGNHDRSSPYSY